MTVVQVGDARVAKALDRVRELLVREGLLGTSVEKGRLFAFADELLEQRGSVAGLASLRERLLKIGDLKHELMIIIN